MLHGLPAWEGFSAYSVLQCPNVCIAQSRYCLSRLYCMHSPKHKQSMRFSLCVYRYSTKCKSPQVNNSKLCPHCVCLLQGKAPALQLTSWGAKHSDEATASPVCGPTNGWVCGEKGAAGRGVLFRPNTGKLLAFSRVVAKQSYKGFPAAAERLGSGIWQPASSQTLASSLKTS